MKTKALSFYWMLLFIVHLIFFKGVLYAAMEEVNYAKANLGVFGGRVWDVTAYDNSGTSEILVGAESIRGVYKWDGASSWQQVTYLNPNLTGTSPIYGQALAVEANLASGFEDDIYAIIHEVSSGGGGPIPTVYCSDDGGDSWNTIATTIADADVLTGDSSGMYVGTDDGYVYRNTGGCTDSFSLIYTAATSARITSISVFDASNYYVMGTSGGSLSIFDRVVEAGSFSIGVSYTIQSIGTTDFTAIGASANTVGVVFTATGAGSGTGTASTSLISTLPATSYSGGSVEVHVVGVDPADADTIFIAGSSANPQVYLSTDGGATWPSSWDMNGGNFQGGYGDYIKFNNNRVFITTVVLEKSGSWSSTWGSSAPLLTTGAITSHPNGGSAFQVDPVDNTIIYMDSDWGLGQMNHTYGSGWTAGTEFGSNNGMDAVVLSGIDFYEYSATSKELWITAKSGAGRVYNSTTGQIYDPTDPTTTDDTSDWLYPIYPMDDGAPLTTVTIDPSDPANVYLGNTGGKVYMTTNGTSTTLAGFSWSQPFDIMTDDPTNVFGTTTPEHSEITAIGIQDFGSCTRIYISGYNWETNEDGGIFYSDDGGSTWTADTINSTGADIDFPVNTLYVTDEKVWAGVGNDQGASTERGLLWRFSLCGTSSFWNPTTGSNLDNEVVTDIDGRYDTTGGTTVNVVYVTTHGGVYRGDKPGSTWSWTDITPASSSTDFTSVTVNPSDEDNAYIAVENCIYETTNGGATWSVLSGTCNTTNEDVKVLKYDDLLAGTATGLYSLSSTASSDDTSSGDEAGDSCFIATAAYGSSMSEGVVVLRKLRDNVLVKNCLGKALVKSYYEISPALASYISNHQTLRTATRIALIPLVYGVRYPKRTALIFLSIFIAIPMTLGVRRFDCSR